METEREVAVRSLNELLGLFMRQAAIEDAAHRLTMRPLSSLQIRSPRQGHREVKRHD